MNFLNSFYLKVKYLLACIVFLLTVSLEFHGQVAAFVEGDTVKEGFVSTFQELGEKQIKFKNQGKKDAKIKLKQGFIRSEYAINPFEEKVLAPGDSLIFHVKFQKAANPDSLNIAIKDFLIFLNDKKQLKIVFSGIGADNIKESRYKVINPPNKEGKHSGITLNENIIDFGQVPIGDTIHVKFEITSQRNGVNSLKIAYLNEKEEEITDRYKTQADRFFFFGHRPPKNVTVRKGKAETIPIMMKVPNGVISPDKETFSQKIYVRLRTVNTKGRIIEEKIILLKGTAIKPPSDDWTWVIITLLFLFIGGGIVFFYFWSKRNLLPTPINILKAINGNLGWFKQLEWNETVTKGKVDHYKEVAKKEKHIGNFLGKFEEALSKEERTQDWDSEFEQEIQTYFSPYLSKVLKTLEEDVTLHRTELRKKLDDWKKDYDSHIGKEDKYDEIKSGGRLIDLFKELLLSSEGSIKTELNLLGDEKQSTEKKPDKETKIKVIEGESSKGSQENTSGHTKKPSIAEFIFAVKDARVSISGYNDDERVEIQELRDLLKKATGGNSFLAQLKRRLKITPENANQGIQDIERFFKAVENTLNYLDVYPPIVTDEVTANDASNLYTKVKERIEFEKQKVSKEKERVTQVEKDWEREVIEREKEIKEKEKIQHLFDNQTELIIKGFRLSNDQSYEDEDFQAEFTKHQDYKNLFLEGSQYVDTGGESTNYRRIIKTIKNNRPPYIQEFIRLVDLMTEDIQVIRNSINEGFPFSRFFDIILKGEKGNSGLIKLQSILHDEEEFLKELRKEGGSETFIQKLNQVEKQFFYKRLINGPYFNTALHTFAKLHHYVHVDWERLNLAEEFKRASVHLQQIDSVYYHMERVLNRHFDMRLIRVDLFKDTYDADIHEKSNHSELTNPAMPGKYRQAVNLDLSPKVIYDLFEIGISSAELGINQKPKVVYKL